MGVPSRVATNNRAWTRFLSELSEQDVVALLAKDWRDQNWKKTFAEILSGTSPQVLKEAEKKRKLKVAKMDADNAKRSSCPPPPLSQS